MQKRASLLRASASARMMGFKSNKYSQPIQKEEDICSKKVITVEHSANK